MSKTARVNVRVDQVQLGKLVKAAGPHGSISSVVRALIAWWCGTGKRP